MKKILKALITAAAVLFLVFITVFILAKKKIIFLNEWFVNEKNNTIGVDISSYQSDVDMEKLREQGIRFVFIKATEGSSSQDEMFPANWENAKKQDFLPVHFTSPPMTVPEAHRPRTSFLTRRGDP